MRIGDLSDLAVPAATDAVFTIAPRMLSTSGVFALMAVRRGGRR